MDVEIPKWKLLLRRREIIRELHAQMLELIHLLKEGVLHGGGQGIVTSKDGMGVATWTGQGVAGLLV